MKKLFAIVLNLFFLCGNLLAQSPQAISYQAVVRNSNGNVIANQSVAVRLSIHDITSGGTIVYQERQTPTTNEFGLFDVNIGQGIVLSGTFSTINWASGSKFIQVELDLNGGTNYTDMGTSQILSVPYALYALTSGNGVGPTGATGPTGADGTTGPTGITGPTGTALIPNNTDSVFWKLNGNSATNPANNFIGTTDPSDFVVRSFNTERLRITSGGVIAVNNPTPNAGDNFASYSTNTNTAISGYANGTGIGLYVSTSASNSLGDAIQVQNNGTAGDGANINLNNSANASIGLLVMHNGTGRAADFQQNNTATTAPTIFASSVGNARVVNVTSLSTSSTSAAVFINQASTQNNISAAALWAQTSSSNAGVFKASLANDNTEAIYAEFDQTGNYDGTGIYGVSTPALGYGYGVVGVGNNFGVYAIGDLGASGVKPFMIDHPQYPGTKYLKHFAMESPEVLNVYRGSITMPSNGEATVQLPPYFQSINKGFTYVLTPVGAPADLYIKQKVDQNGTFVIAGGQAGLEVSWYVYADRNDQYVQTHPENVEVEPAKHAAEVGKYIYPEFFNQPKEKGVFYREQKEQVLLRDIKPGSKQNNGKD